MEGDSEPYENNRVSASLSLKKPGSGQRKSIAEKNDHSLQLKTPENEATQKKPRIAHRTPQPVKKQPKILVDSYKAADQYDIQTWNLVAFPSGFVVSIRTESGIVATNSSISLSNGDYLILSGRQCGRLGQQWVFDY